MEDDRRRGARTGVLKRAKLVFGNDDMSRSVIDCVVMDLSPTGARVRTGTPVTVPEWVTFLLPDGMSSRARRRWTRGNEIGLELTSSDHESLLEAMIAGLSEDQRRALIARIEATLVPKSDRP